MLGSAQLKLRDPQESAIAEIPRSPALPERHANDGQCLALIRSLAGDMPLRLAAASPEDRPSLTGATMRLRRFVRFYPAFTGAALFSTDGKLLTSADFRTSNIPVESDLFWSEQATLSLGVATDEALARAVSPFGGDTLLYANVHCPRGTNSCGMLVTRLR
ncbi:MAG: hypothetical protein WA979_04720 [Pacificimonas sp.]